MNRRVAHLSSNLHGLFATGSIRSRAVLCRRCIHSCKRWGESSVWWVSEEETYSKSNRQKLTLVLAEAELLLPSLPAPVAQRCAVLLKTCTTGAGDAVAFFFFFFARGTLLGCPGWASAPLSTPACFCSFVWRCSLPPLGCLKLVWTKYRTEEQARRGRGME